MFVQNTKNYIKTNNIDSANFQVMDKLKQGEDLSPTLFIVLMDNILWELKDKVHKLRIGYRKLEVVQQEECAFADDLMICAENERKPQKKTQKIEKISLKNVNKQSKNCKVVIGKENKKIDIRQNGGQIGQVGSCKYLKVTIQNSGKIEK